MKASLAMANKKFATELTFHAIRHICLIMNIKVSSQDAIIEAAFATLSASPDASLSDIAKAAGVGRATLHRYFASRDDLMIALRDIAAKELASAVAISTRHSESYLAGLMDAFKAIVPLANRQWFLVQTEQDDAGASDLRKTIEAAKSEGSISQTVPTAWIANTYNHLLYASWILVRDGEATAKQAADYGWKTFEDGTLR